MDGNDPQEHAAVSERLRGAVRLLDLSTRNYVADVSRRAQLGPVDVHAIGVLRAAAREGREVTVGDLGRELSLSRPATSALVHRMERARHARRIRSTADGRTITVRLTDSAHLLSEEMFRDLIACYDTVLAGYSTEQLEVVTEIMTKLDHSTRACLRPHAENNHDQ